MHPDQLSVPLTVVRALVDDQFPDWAHLPLTAVTSEGTVNTIVRIGDGLAARFPLRPGEAAWERLRAEADAARELAGHTRFPTPEPVALGRPGPGYPFRTLCFAEMLLSGEGLGEWSFFTPENVAAQFDLKGVWVWHIPFFWIPHIPEMLITGREREF